MNIQEKLLEDLKSRLIKDKSLPLMESNLVFGEGSAQADVFFIGEAPGLKEDQVGRPFIGRSGQLLTKILNEIGLKREDVYISNIVKRRPPENRDPFPSEIEKYKPYLQEQIKIINPKIIVTLGRFALNFFIPEAKISSYQGRVFKLEEGIIILPMFHPAAALRSTKNLVNFKNGFFVLKKILK